jgi:hypothetical protein
MNKVPKEEYDQILAEISSENSPVGIDARKTHILILHELKLLHQRLDKIESSLKKV